MTTASRYVIGLAVVAAGALVTGLAAGPGRNAVWVGAAIALLAQGPLGWWLVRTVGGPRFLQVWGAGLLGRLGLVAAAGMVLLASESPQAQVTLIALAGVLVALLGVEIAVLLRGHSTHEGA